LNFRKFKKNAKALSPVIATIILIAVTVAVSVVVAAWMGALTIGFMGNSEQASITNVVLSNVNTGADGQAVITVQNTGSASVTINLATIDGKTAVINSPTPAVIAKGSSVDVTITVAGYPFANSAQYTIKLQTAKGNSLTTSASYTGP
jgi:flagellin-like protein